MDFISEHGLGEDLIHPLVQYLSESLDHPLEDESSAGIALEACDAPAPADSSSAPPTAANRGVSTSKHELGASINGSHASEPDAPVDISSSESRPPKPKRMPRGTSPRSSIHRTTLSSDDLLPPPKPPKRAEVAESSQSILATHPRVVIAPADDKLQELSPWRGDEEDRWPARGLGPSGSIMSVHLEVIAIERYRALGRGARPPAKGEGYVAERLALSMLDRQLSAAGGEVTVINNGCADGVPFMRLFSDFSFKYFDLEVPPDRTCTVRLSLVRQRMTIGEQIATVLASGTLLYSLAEDAQASECIVPLIDSSGYEHAKVLLYCMSYPASAASGLHAGSSDEALPNPAGDLPQGDIL
jgi:hypothetical protein